MYSTSSSKSSEDSNELHPSRKNPHIRLNSDTDDLIPRDLDRNTSRNGRPKPRLLTSQSKNPFNQNAISPFSDTPNTSSSTEHLLPPPRRVKSSNRYRDDPFASPTGSPGGSRRNSVESLRSSSGTRTPLSPYAHTFSDSRAPSRAGSEDDDINTQTVAEKYNIHPDAGLILYPEDVEKDDWLHTPMPGEKEPRDCDIFNKRGMCNVGSLIVLGLGVLTLFVVFPAVTFVRMYTDPSGPSCSTDANCIRADLPLLKAVRQGLIDPDTPQSAMTRKTADGKTQNLVFSDEFNTDGRSFYGGDDAYFQAVDLWYGVTQDLEWYDPDAVTTKDGTLQIRFDAFQNHGLNYRSGMLQSWNQMCFKGGHLEASISLPGAGDTIGFWPGFWAMGNLGRPGYASTTDGLWPYSYWDECDAGITKNQSTPDGLSFLPGMRLPACPCAGADHPTPGKSRTAPEIDALEASVTFLTAPESDGIGSASQSGQFAPFDVWYQPNYDFVEVYDSSVTQMNAYRGGFFQQALSAVTNLNNEWYNGKAYQKYAFDYSPGSSGKITWYVGEDPSWSLDARAIGPNGNIGQRVIPVEPMAIVANLGMSNSFAALNFTGLGHLMPATMRFDYIRVYQSDDDYIGCDPPGYPTTEYIARHPSSYRDRDKTQWAQTGYAWPKNTFVDQCPPMKGSSSSS